MKKNPHQSKNTGADFGRSGPRLRNVYTWQQIREKYPKELDRIAELGGDVGVKVNKLADKIIAETDFERSACLYQLYAVIRNAAMKHDKD